MKKGLLILFSCIISFFPLFSIDDIQLHLKVVALEKAVKPEFYFNQILFTADPEPETRHVGIAFSHENFKEIHSFQKNEKGIYFFIMNIPSEPLLDYRLIIDGIWQVDPNTEQQIEGVNGITISRLNIPREYRPVEISPLVTSQGQVKFTYSGLPGNAVYIAGDFNHWDPYMIPLNEIKPGEYQVTLKMTPGTHFYNFFVNGKAMKDPQNREFRLNQYGEELSVLFIPQ